MSTKKKRRVEVERCQLYGNPAIRFPAKDGGVTTSALVHRDGSARRPPLIMKIEDEARYWVDVYCSTCEVTRDVFLKVKALLE